MMLTPRLQNLLWLPRVFIVHLQLLGMAFETFLPICPRNVSSGILSVPSRSAPVPVHRAPCWLGAPSPAPTVPCFASALGLLLAISAVRYELSGDRAADCSQAQYR